MRHSVICDTLVIFWARFGNQTSVTVRIWLVGKVDASPFKKIYGLLFATLHRFKDMTDFFTKGNLHTSIDKGLNYFNQIPF